VAQDYAAGKGREISAYLPSAAARKRAASYPP
jgi:hypothetical protein